MRAYEEAVTCYTDDMGYLKNPKLLGIVVYGSYTTGCSTKTSDIDLLIVMDDSVKEMQRGAVTINGYKIEYFIKPLAELYTGANIEFYMQSNASLPIIGCGKILYEKNNAITNLRDYILMLYSNPLPPLSRDDAIEQAAIIDTALSRLQASLENNAIDFNSSFYLIIEKIRKLYSRMSGCADIPAAKAVKIYTDERYRLAFCKSQIPDLEFIEKYLELLAFEGPKMDKLELIKAFFAYVTRDLGFDPNNYKTRIKSRYGLLNSGHKD